MVSFVNGSGSERAVVNVRADVCERRERGLLFELPESCSRGQPMRHQPKLPKAEPDRGIDLRSLWVRPSSAWKYGHSIRAGVYMPPLGEAQPDAHAQSRRMDRPRA